MEVFMKSPDDAVAEKMTTINPNHDQLQQLFCEVGLDRSLLVLCTAFRARADRYTNLTVKKIPKAVLVRYEWDHDDYSLWVACPTPLLPRVK
jgi:adenine-specific DNA-methyltransferase